MPIRGDDFKNALRRWASGVTVVTACAGERIHGMTVSAFAGVSLDPPLVLVCADKGSDTLQVIADGGVFAVN
ncbi:MAG: flavin reductase, partial [Deltaproteobacteria bacterium]